MNPWQSITYLLMAIYCREQLKEGALLIQPTHRAARLNSSVERDVMKSVTHTKSFELDAPIDDLFPLFSPEGEKRWVPGWDYKNIMGTTDLSEDSVFLTKNNENEQTIPKAPCPKTIQHRYSKMAGCKYWANTCPYCKSIQGDFFLYNEPDSPLFGFKCGEDSVESYKSDMLALSINYHFGW